MPNPKSGTFDVGNAVSPLSSRHASWLPETWPATRIGNAIRALAIRFFAWRAQQATLRLLSSLDAAMLRDLGLTDVESEVYGNPRDRLRPYHPDWWHGARYRR